MSKDKGIKLSPKYGVNPTLPICWWCGEETGEVAMLGMLPGDEEAPKHAVLDYHPCDSCLEKHKQGIVIVESTGDEGDNGFKHATGRWSVLKTTALDDMIEDQELRNTIKQRGICFMDVETYTMLMEGYSNDGTSGQD